MAYNPDHLVPPDNRNADWCAYCGDQIFPYEDDEDSFKQMANGEYVHMCCMAGYADGLLFQIRGLERKLNEIIGKEFV